MEARRSVVEGALKAETFCEQEGAKITGMRKKGADVVLEAASEYVAMCRTGAQVHRTRMGEAEQAMRAWSLRARRGQGVLDLMESLRRVERVRADAAGLEARKRSWMLRSQIIAARKRAHSAEIAQRMEDVPQWQELNSVLARIKALETAELDARIATKRAQASLIRAEKEEQRAQAKLGEGKAELARRKAYDREVEKSLEQADLDSLASIERQIVDVDADVTLLRSEIASLQSQCHSLQHPASG